MIPLGRCYYTHFTDKKLIFVKFEPCAQPLWFRIQTLIHFCYSARTELFTKEFHLLCNKEIHLHESLRKLCPASPFVLICLAMKNANRNAKKTVSRSFIGSDGFWFSASCYSPFSFSKDSQWVLAFSLLSQLLWCSVIETSSSMVTRKNKRAHTSPVSTYWTDFKKEWTQYSSRIPSGNKHW